MRTISFKVSDDEALSIQLQARQAKLSVSEFLRRRAVETEHPVAVTRVRCQFTGAEIFGPVTGKEPLTLEGTREILADFP